MVKVCRRFATKTSLRPLSNLVISPNSQCRQETLSKVSYFEQRLSKKPLKT